MIEPRPGSALVALVTHARDVESEAREAFAAAAAPLAADPRVIVLRTCHRVEVYAVEEDPGVPDASVPAGPGSNGRDANDGDDSPIASLLPALPDGGRRLRGTAAARHLFLVAAGLDSVVVGEDQILHQLRECLAGRHALGVERCLADGLPADLATGGLDPVLERLFQIALHLGRETRSWREGPPRSLADVALDRVEAATGDLIGKRVLVVGAGRMARLAALSASRRGASVLVANRSADRGAALAFDAGGDPVPFGESAPLPACDAIVTAISARWPLGPLARGQLVDGTQPLVDLSSPPAVGPELRAALDGRFTSVDDLARSPQAALRDRLRRRFERVIDDAEATFSGWLRARSTVPAIQALSEHAESRRLEELERLFRRMELTDHQRELVEQMSHRLVAGILHAPLVTLREDQSGDLEQAVRTLFAL